MNSRNSVLWMVLDAVFAGFILALVVGTAHCQPLAAVFTSNGAPTSGCNSNQLDVDFVSGNLYTCVNGLWQLSSGSGSGTVNSSATVGSLTYYQAATNAVRAVGPDYIFNTHTLTAAATAIFDASAVTPGNLKLPTAAGAAPTADGGIAVNSTTHTLVFGSNGSTLTAANAGSACGAHNWITALSGSAGPTCTQPAFADLSGVSTVALTTNPLSQFASTTSAQLLGVMSDATGTGSLVFSNGPTFVAPVLGAASASSLSLTSTPLGVASGGTGLATCTAHGVPVGEGTSAMVCTAVGTAGQVLTSNGAGVDPTYQSVAGTVTHAVGALTSGSFMVGNGTGDSKVSNVTTDAGLNNVVAPGSLTTGSGSGKTGYVEPQGATSGGQGFTVSDVAGTATLYVLPTAVSSGSFLKDNGSATCPTLPAGAPAACEQLAWANPAGSGTLTSVSWTGGIVSIANPTSTPAFTIAGTSGGIPYFSGAATWASSAALTANAMVLGGGAGSAPKSGDVQDVSNVLNSASATTQAVTYAGGQDASANSVLGNVIVRGANETGAGGATSAGGGALIEGGTNAATNAASQGGSVQLLPGASTSGTVGLQGLLVQTVPYLQGATVTQWNLQCESAAMTVADCAATPNSWIGVAELKVASTTATVQVAVPHSQVPINASAAVTLGDTVCAGSTAGKVTDSGGTATCTNAQGSTVGVVMATSGTWTLPDGTAFTASTTLPLIAMQTAAQIPTSGGGSGNLASFAGGFAAAMSASQTQYGSPNGSVKNATESNMQVPNPATGTLKQFTACISSAQPASGSVVFTLRKAGASTTQTVTFAASAAAGCTTDSTHTTASTQGDLLSVQVVNNATAATGNISWAFIEN